MGFVTGGAKAMGMDTSEVDRTLDHFESLYRVLGTHSPGDEVDKLMEGALSEAFDPAMIGAQVIPTISGVRGVQRLMRLRTPEVVRDQSALLQASLVDGAVWMGNRLVSIGYDATRAVGKYSLPFLSKAIDRMPEWGTDPVFEVEGLSVGALGMNTDLGFSMSTAAHGTVWWEGAGRTIETKTRPYIEKQVRENLMGQWAKQEGITVRALEKQHTPEQIEEYLRAPLASNTDALYAKEREKLAGLVRDVRGAKASRVPVTPEFKRVEEVK
jgi:hypothetical protein